MVDRFTSRNIYLPHEHHRFSARKLPFRFLYPTRPISDSAKPIGKVRADMIQQAFTRSGKRFNFSPKKLFRLNRRSELRPKGRDEFEQFGIYVVEGHNQSANLTNS